ncbi:MAG: M23 family metallopeptidase [Clostridiaceae bacterium]|nr:M23 family metallopeptidase [Clostridiaceae bacterium]
MRKGKAKKTEKKYLSIVLVPHSSSKVKVFKFSSFYAKIIACVILLTSIFVAGGLYISRMLDENKSLKQNIDDLYSTNTQQRKLIEEKTDEVEQLKVDSAIFNEIVNDKIEEFTNSFNQITDDYIEERSKKTDRSGDRTETEFTNDMRELKGTLDSLSKLYSRSDVPVADLSSAEAKIEAFMDTVPTLWPSNGRLTDKFGYRRDPFTRRNRFHAGIDIAANSGTKIKAAASGKVIFAEYTGGTGRTVKISHARGITTVYGHASSILVEKGQTVKKGDVIAKVGSSGRSTGPHLHFEILLYGSAVDPLKYLDVK